MKTDTRASGFDFFPFWSAVSMAVAVAATAFSPLLLMMASSCCSGPHDPTNGVFLLPAIPLLILIHALGIQSMISYCLGIGLSYGALCYFLGLLIFLFRAKGRR